MSESPRPRPGDPRDPGLSRRQRLVATTRRSTSSSTSAALEEFPTNTLPGFTEQLLAAAARPAGALLLPRPHGRLRRAAQRGHLARPRHRARRPRAPAGRRPRHPARQDPPGQGRARAATTSSTGTSTSRSASRPAGSPYGWSTTWSRPTPTSTSSRSSSRSSSAPSAPRSARRRRRSSTRRCRRDIPWIRLNQYSLVQLGQGVHAEADPGHHDLGDQRDRRRRRLRQGPHHPAARRRRAAGARSRSRCAPPTRRCAAAKRIGYPVVVKPLDGNHGRGVCLDLQDEDDVREAFPIAEEQSRRGWVIVESFVTGKDYRCLIIDGRMAAIAERVPAHVIGDGTQHRRAARRR